MCGRYGYLIFWMLFGSFIVFFLCFFRYCLRPSSRQPWSRRAQHVRKSSASPQVSRRSSRRAFR